MSSTSRSRNQVNRRQVKALSEVLGTDFKEALRLGVREYLQSLLFDIAKALMAGEVSSLCGEPHERVPDRKHTRHGYQKGTTVTLDAAKTHIERPRVRNVQTNEETVLETYKAINNKAFLDERTLALVSAGLPERQFAAVLEKGLKRVGVSPSAISRRVIRSTQISLEQFEQRRWEKHRFVALLFDGVKVGRTMVVACIGVDLGGRKHVLAVHPGATESARVCRDLIRKLIDNGLDVDGNYLFVVDGSKALRSAIQDRFGKEAVFQRCQEHKIRDVESYLPYKERDRIRSRMQSAYNNRSLGEASKRLQDVRFDLSLLSDQAVKSLTEGLDDTLTLHRLGIWGGLRDSLRTTNIIESAFSTLRKKTKNITNWQDEPQVNRWMAHGLMEAEKKFRKVQGRRTLTRLRRKLEERYSASQST
jgi:putative transposase